MRRIFYTFRKFAATIFGRVFTKKPSKIVKFTKIHQTLRNTYISWPKRDRVKLVVPPNSLKQKNVCLIPTRRNTLVKSIDHFSNYVVIEFNIQFTVKIVKFRKIKVPLQYMPDPYRRTANTGMNENHWWEICAKIWI